MKNKLIVKACEDFSRVYVFEIKGYIPYNLEGDFDIMATRLASDKYRNLEGKLKDLCRFYKKKNKLVIKFKVSHDPKVLDEEIVRKIVKKSKITIITVRVRKSIKRILLEHI